MGLDDPFGKRQDDGTWVQVQHRLPCRACPSRRPGQVASSNWITGTLALYEARGLRVEIPDHQRLRGAMPLATGDGQGEGDIGVRVQERGSRRRVGHCAFTMGEESVP